MRAAFADAGVAAQVAQDGYAVVDLLGETEVRMLREMRTRTRGDLDGMPYSATLMSRDPVYRRDVHAGIHEMIANPLRGLLPGHRLCHANFTIKRPHAPESAVPLHQDWSFVDEARHLALAVWCPLVDVAAGNGGLSVVPRSDRLNQQPRSTLLRFPYPDLTDLITRRYAVGQQLRSGQAVLFNTRLMHSSPPNLGDHERAAVAGLLVPDRTPLRLYYAAPARPDVVRVFGVPDDFFLSYLLNAAPDPGLPQVDEFALRVDPVDLSRLARCLGGDDVAHR